MDTSFAIKLLCNADSVKVFGLDKLKNQWTIEDMILDYKIYRMISLLAGDE